MEFLKLTYLPDYKISFQSDFYQEILHPILVNLPLRYQLNIDKAIYFTKLSPKLLYAFSPLYYIK
jgi:hypothetical protein